MIALLVPLFLAAAPVQETLSLQECVRIALEKNTEIASADAQVDAARAARSSMVASYGPRLRLEGNYLRYPEEYGLAFGPGAPPVIVREEATSSLTVSVIQPITPLVAVNAGHRARSFGVDAARVHREAVQRDVAYNATEAYYRVLQALRLAEVAATSVKQVESQVTRAKSFEKQGAVGRNDVLRAEIALAGATQRRIQADGAVALAQARLAIALGLPSGSTITPSSVPDAAAPPPVASADDAVARALESRQELQEIDARVSMARAGKQGAWTKLAPQINAIGSYSRVDGIAFQEEETRFVGVLLTWDAWDWGSSYFGAREAAAGVRQAEAARAAARNMIALDARAAQVTYTSSSEALHVAAAAVAQAEENYRIESRRYEQNAATTFDVLDAESLLTQARAQQQTALYDSHIAAANLQRALGQTPGAGSP